MQTNHPRSFVSVSSVAQRSPVIWTQGRISDRPGLSPLRARPPNQDPPLICASTTNVASRRSRRGFSLSLTAWYRDTASVESLQRLSRVSQHLRGCPPTPSTPFRVARARYRHAGCYYRSWFQIFGSPSVTPTLGASFSGPSGAVSRHLGLNGSLSHPANCSRRLGGVCVRVTQARAVSKYHKESLAP